MAYTTAYSYDALNRPLAVSWDPAPAATAPASGPIVTFGHVYNKANQRSGESSTDSTWLGYPAASPATIAYTANNLNQYTAVGAVTPTYDANGNLTFDGAYTLEHDSENRLVSATDGTTGAAYAFDGRGRRKLKAVGETSVAISVTDADNREVLEYDGLTGALLRWYAYGLGSNAVLNQMNVGAGTRYTLVPNLLGSIAGSYDSTGALTKFGYQPYGSGAAAPQFAYTGQRIDPETGGLYYYRARHYSTAWGRFVQADPIENAVGQSQYAYVKNDPLNATDPEGLVEIELRYSSLSPLGYTHAYLVVRDTDGSPPTYFRAGPSAGGPSGGSPGAVSSGVGGSAGQSAGSNSNSANSSSPGSGRGGAGANLGPYGRLTTTSGPYVRGTIDYEVSPRASQVIISNDRPAAPYIAQLKQFSSRVDAANIPYNPFSTNSNAFAHQAVEALGIARPSPPVWAPGWSTQLPLPEGNSQTPLSSPSRLMPGIMKP